MGTGAITGYLDVAQLVLYAFWAFFAGLIYYLVRENHREGYPMDPGPNSDVKVTGFPVPSPKYFLLEDGSRVPSPNPDRMDWPVDLKHVQLRGAGGGAPFEPTGNPMLDGIGPGAYANRADEPEHTTAGTPKIFPLRNDTEYGVAQTQGRDPRGMPILGDDGQVGGTVVDLWLDGPESLFRYLEVNVPGNARNVLVPLNSVRIRDDHVTCKAIMGAHFAQIPVTRNPDVVTLLEEEKIFGFFGGGTLYADPRRVEPLL
jgi:photosynthetic reaction center H subunit